MSAADLPDLLRRRFDMVARLSEATSQLQKLQQLRMSAEIDVQRCEMGDDDAHESQPEWREAMGRMEQAERDMGRCEAAIAEIESGLDATDREIETLSGRRSAP